MDMQPEGSEEVSARLASFIMVPNKRRAYQIVKFRLEDFYRNKRLGTR